MRTFTRVYFGAMATVLAVALGACSAPSTGASSSSTAATPGSAGSAGSAAAGSIPAKPSAPVSLHILDVAGNQKLTGPMVAAFVKAHPDIISSVSWESAGAPDLVGTIKPQVDSGKLSVDLVMTGTDGLSAGIGQNL